jgi:hypothetical protein
MGSPPRFCAGLAGLARLPRCSDFPSARIRRHIHCRSDAFRSIRGGCAAGLVGVGATAAIDAAVHGLCPNCRLGSSSAIAGTAPPGADAGTEDASRVSDGCSDPVGEEGPRSLMAGPISPRDHHTGIACARGSTQACSADAQPQAGSSPFADHQHAHTCACTLTASDALPFAHMHTHGGCVQGWTERALCGYIRTSGAICAAGRQVRREYSYPFG